MQITVFPPGQSSSPTCFSHRFDLRSEFCGHDHQEPHWCRYRCQLSLGAVLSNPTMYQAQYHKAERTSESKTGC